MPVTNDTQLREKKKAGKERDFITVARAQCNRSITAKRVSVSVKIDDTVPGQVEKKKKKEIKNTPRDIFIEPTLIFFGFFFFAIESFIEDRRRSSQFLNFFFDRTINSFEGFKGDTRLFFFSFEL